MEDVPRLKNFGKVLFEAAVQGRQTRAIVTEYSLKEVAHDEDLDYKKLKLKILHLVAWAGDLDSVKELKSWRLADPAARTTGGFSALHLAASKGHTEVVAELVTWLQSDAEPVSDRGFTPLHLAAYGGHKGTVDFLLKARNHLSIDVNAQDQIFGRSALHFAVLSGSEDAVKMLMSVDGVVIDLKDKVRELTPFLLAAMQSTDECKLRIVLGLLNKDYTQITCKVGPLKKVDDFYKESWQLLTGIGWDDSVKPVPDVADVHKDEKDGYQRCGMHIMGHNILHVAATQGNAELMTSLVCLPGVTPLLNEKAMFGMTPLHCAIWVDCPTVIFALAKTEGVDINAQLDDDGKSPRPSWLPAASEFELGTVTWKGLDSWKLDEHISSTVGSFVHYDTPLHLAIRICRAKHLLDLLPAFWNHPKFNGAILNGERQTSLELGWVRLGWCGRIPSTYSVQFKPEQFPPLNMILEEDKEFEALAMVGKSRYRENSYLSEMITVLERHPTNAPVLAQREGMRKAALDSVTAFLVTAVLLASLSFSGFLQPPSSGKDPDGGEPTSTAAQLFWTFNSLSFFFAVQCILTSLHQCIQSDEKLYLFGSSLYLAFVRVQGVVPLTLSVGFGILTFVVAGFANVPSDSKPLIIACTVGGSLLVLYQLFRNLKAGFVTLKDSFWHSEEPIVSFCFLIQAQALLLIHGVYNDIRVPCVRGKIRPELFRQAGKAAYMTDVIGQMTTAAVVVVYALAFIF